MRNFLKKGRAISVLRSILFYGVSPVMDELCGFRHTTKI